jgi:ABC-type nitrate/sulfonate/bicarbonate transport system substrate-binding protein
MKSPGTKGTSSMQRKSRASTFIRLAGASLLTVAALLTPRSVNAEPLKLAYTNNLYSAQIIVAIEKGLFAKHSIELEPSVFASGKLTMDAVLAGAVDLSTSAETPITAAVMAGRPIAVFARLLRSAPTLLVNSGAGIKEISDLKGKKIGITAGTGNEVALYEVLRHASIKVSDVTLINLRPEDMPAAFSNKSVDAINNYQPVISNAQRALGDQAKILDTQGMYTETFNLVGMKKPMEAKSTLVANTLSTLIDADTFMQDHKPEAIALLSRVIGVDTAVVEQAWPNFTFRVGLDPDVISIFKAHSQWRLDTGNVPPGVDKVPDFQAVVVPGPLKSIAADRVVSGG